MECNYLYYGSVLLIILFIRDTLLWSVIISIIGSVQF